MRNKLLSLGFVAFAALWCASCGGAASGGSSGTATVASLSSLPSVDLSNYDYSSSGGSAMIAKVEAASSSAQSSRAGCEANSQKDNAIKQSMMAQLSRCYPEAMEAGGLISIPTGSYGYYRIAVPKSDDFSVNSEKTMYMRLGRFGEGSILHVDMCQDRGSGAAQNDSSTYTASGSDYIVNVVHAETHGEFSFSGSFDVTFKGATVTNGTVAFDAAGEVLADGVFIDNFGKGRMHFGAFPADEHNEIQGIFHNSFTDPTFGTQDFESKVYALFGGAGTTKTGTALFSFDGSFPAFPASQMLPPGMPPEEANEMYGYLSAQLGQTVIATTLLCPPNDCSESRECFPTVAAGATCEQSMDDIESFSISGIAPDLTFALIADDASAFYAAVSGGGSAILAALAAPTESSVPFTRVWDCQPVGAWQEINPEEIFAADIAKAPDLAALRAKMEACVETERLMSERDGMDSYSCQSDEVKDTVENDAGCEGESCSFELTWDKVACFPETDTGTGPLMSIWDAMGPVAQYDDFGDNYGNLVKLCNACTGSSGADAGCDQLMTAFQDLGK